MVMGPPPQQPGPPPPYGAVPYQPPRPVNVPGILALVAAVVGFVLALVADQTAVISAETPAIIAVLSSLAAVVLGIVGVTRQLPKGLAVAGLVIGILVFAFSVYEVAAIQHQLDVARQCLSDLIACGQSQN